MMQMDRIMEPNAATLSLLTDIALSESEVGVKAQRKLLKELDCVKILLENVRRLSSEESFDRGTHSTRPQD